MITTIYTFFTLSIISLFPIVIWGYIFAYIDDNPINKKRFLVGIFGGILSVFPILYMDKILSLFNLQYLNIFSFAYKLKDFFSTIEFGGSLSLFLLFLAVSSLLPGYRFIKNKDILKIYLKNIIVFLFGVIFLSILLLLLNYLFGLENTLDFFSNIKVEQVGFKDVVFNTFKLVIFYYFIVAFIEETSKHFNFLQSSILYVDSIKTGVLYAIFVALGFSLIENILYLKSSLEQIGISSEFFKVYFFRSFFSVMVHVICSSLIAYYFCKALIMYRDKKFSFPYFKIFFTGLLLGVLFHLIFDISLSIGFEFIIFIYFIGGYLYVSSIFYREK